VQAGQTKPLQPGHFSRMMSLLDHAPAEWCGSLRRSNHPRLLRQHLHWKAAANWSRDRAHLLYDPQNLAMTTYNPSNHGSNISNHRPRQSRKIPNQGSSPGLSNHPLRQSQGSPRSLRDR
jgi:hypothetical protein